MATVVFFPEGAFGPTNNCVGIGDVLRHRGHRVVFVVESRLPGTSRRRASRSVSCDSGPPPEVEEIPGQFWKDFIRDTAPHFRRPTIEQLGLFLQPTWQALIDGSKYVNDRLVEIFDELTPDVIVEDNVVAFPAIAASGRPWVRIVSCNPLELRDPDIPPVFSGYPVADRSGWDEFREEHRRTHGDMWTDFDAFVREHGAPALPELEFMHEPPSSTSTSIRRRSTTSGRSRSRRPGTGSSARCAGRSTTGRPRSPWRDGRERSSTSVSGASRPLISS